MLELLSPEMLFNKQKVFHVNTNVEHVITNTRHYKVVVVFNQPAETLPAAMKEMLEKLIQACKFKTEDTIYLNSRFTPDITLGNLQNEYNPVAILIFGEVNISRNISTLKKNLAYELSGVKIVNTDSLDTLVQNDAAKKALWGVLKKMLGL